MTFDDDLTRRLTDRAAEIDAAPDLDEVEAGSRRRRNRRRGAAAVAGVAAVALGIAGVVLVGSDSDPNRISSTSDTTGSTDDDAVGAAVAAETSIVTLPPADVDAATTEVDSDASTPDVDPLTTEPALRPDDAGPLGPDPAEELLVGSVEIFSGSVEGHEVAVRRSSVGVADLLDLEWEAPTGSEECFGTSALFIGVPGQRERGYTGSDWLISPEYDDPSRAVEVHDYWINAEQNSVGEHPIEAIVWIVTSPSGADDVIVYDAVGDQSRQAPFVEGVAVLVVDPGIWMNDGQPSVAIVDDGVVGDAQDLSTVLSRRDTSPEAGCVPGPRPQPPLPDAGEPPADPVAAEAEIREVHAALIDRTIPISEDGPELLDDATGVAEAVDAMNAGAFAERAAAAEYTIHDVVFTAPDEAWFDYTITAAPSTFDRFGMARFDGTVWQITRQTVCQDLALAGGPCEPEAGGDIVPPLPPGWSAVIAEYERDSNLYWPIEACPLPYIRC